CLVVLLRRQPLEGGRANHLQPDRSAEGEDEGERQAGEDEANAPVRQPRAHGFRSRYVVSFARAWTSPSPRACAWTRAAACALDSSDASAALSACSRVRSRPS